MPQSTPRGLGRGQDRRGWGIPVPTMSSEGVARDLVIRAGRCLSNGSLLLFCLPPPHTHAVKTTSTVSLVNSTFTPFSSLAERFAPADVNKDGTTDFFLACTLSLRLPPWLVAVLVILACPTFLRHLCWSPCCKSCSLLSSVVLHRLADRDGVKWYKRSSPTVFVTQFVTQNAYLGTFDGTWDVVAVDMNGDSWSDAVSSSITTRVYVPMQ